METITIVFLAIFGVCALINVFAKSFAIGFIEVLAGLGVLATGDNDILLLISIVMMGIGALTMLATRKDMGKVM